MKKKMTIVVSILMALMIAACGGNSTPAQETSDKPAAEAAQDEKQEAEAEAAQDEKQEAEAEAAQDEVTVQESEAAEAAPESTEAAEVKIDDPTSAKYWQIKDGKLLGLIGQDSFGVLTDVPEELGVEDANGVAISQNRDQILLKSDTAFIRIDLSTKEFTIINEGAMDSWYDRGQGYVYYIDTNHDEYVITDWTTSDSEKSSTGEKIDNYICKKPDMEILDFEQFVTLLREDPSNSFDLCFYVDEDRNIYNFYLEYMSNLDLPEVDWNPAFPMKDGTAWINSDNKLGVYSLGEEKYSYQLPDGTWKVVGANADSFLIYNNDESAVYRLYGDELTQIQSDVVDVQAFENIVYLVDSNGTGYYGNWLESDMQTVDHCQGVSHYKKYPGFITEDGNVNFNGVNIIVK